jgi:hypothetical protein
MMQWKTIYCFIILLVITGLMWVSCKSNSASDVSCAECYRKKPDSAIFTVKITINDENLNVPILVLRGKYSYNYSPSQVEFFDTVTEGNCKLRMPVNNYYSIRAEYKKGSKIIYVVDGDDLSITEVNDVCDTTCWVINGGYVNVRLKD